MIKQFIISRCDLGLRKGAISAQNHHAGDMWFADRITNGTVVGGGIVNMKVAAIFTADELAWLDRPSTLVVLRAENKEQFLDIERQLRAAGLNPYVWDEPDLGGEPTAMAIGPIDEELVKPITGQLKLLQ